MDIWLPNRANFVYLAKLHEPLVNKMTRYPPPHTAEADWDCRSGSEFRHLRHDCSPRCLTKMTRYLSTPPHILSLGFRQFPRPGQTGFGGGACPPWLRSCTSPLWPALRSDRWLINGYLYRICYVVLCYVVTVGWTQCVARVTALYWTPILNCFRFDTHSCTLMIILCHKKMPTYNQLLC